MISTTSTSERTPERASGISRWPALLALLLATVMMPGPQSGADESEAERAEKKASATLALQRAKRLLEVARLDEARREYERARCPRSRRTPP